MATTIASFDSGHEAMIHDAQLDYYGKRLATCSSDRTIKIFEVAGETQTFVAQLKGHDGPVWQVAWAHPKFGNLLASCGYDRKVIIWKEGAQHQWSKVYEYSEHESSVNSLAWAPWEYGLILAAASSDGAVSVHTRRPDDTWDVKSFHAHAIGCNAISWSPATHPGTLTNAQLGASSTLPPKRFVTGGCDNNIRIWKCIEAENRWVEEDRLEGHKDWVRDVAWAPNIGMPSQTIASCSEDRTVVIWTQEAEGSSWMHKTLPLSAPVWRVSWSITGNILAASCGDNKVYLYKETLEGNWELISAMNEAGVLQTEVTSPVEVK
eukprot:GILJ01001757.1.p1 GENE.GILJ01001757.1~~GILJ01001757.1.p1  ORF type:complete len:340 (+),score=22.35 GILJ01001757.1:60-1022(+)